MVLLLNEPQTDVVGLLFLAFQFAAWIWNLSLVLAGDCYVAD